MESRRHRRKLQKFRKTLSIRNNKWSSLPDDLLNLILAELSFIDRLRFAAVCSHWRSVHITRPSPLPPQYPCLIVPGNNQNSAKLLNLSENKLYDIPMLRPLVDQSFFIGSSKGWLVTVSTKTLAMQLLNPITSAHIPLPSITVPYPRKPYWRNMKAVLFFETADDFMVMLIQGIGNGAVSVAKHGDKTWTLIAVIGEVCDLIQHNNMLFTVTDSGNVQIWDSDGRCCSTINSVLVRNFGWFGLSRKYFVQSKTGDLFMIAELGLDGFPNFNFRRFNVLKFYRYYGVWDRVEDIGEQAFFIGNNQGLALSTKEYPGLFSNCIYFAKNDEVGIYNVLSGGITKFGCSSDLVLDWFPPIWVTPSLST